MTTAERPLFALPDPELVRQHGRARAALAGLGASAAGPARTAPRLLGPHLRIAVLVPRTDIGGGARILFELSDRLLERGHQVTVLSHAPAPTWFFLRAPFTEVPVGLALAHAVPACDVVLAGYWELVPEVAALQIAPVVHLEQGDFHLFEEIPAAQAAVVRRALSAADAHTVVSGTVSHILEQRYGVRAEVVPNAVDPATFHPHRGGTALPAARRSVLAVGWDGNAFKGIDAVRRLAGRLRTSHPDVDVVWVTPKPPVEAPGHIARVVVAPSQAELAALYRDAALFVCASHYESFSLPAMEAMSCGTPVVSTTNPGALEYSRDGENALLVPVADDDALGNAVTRVLDDADLAARLRAGGERTSAAYSWDAVVSRAEEVYRRVAEAGAALDDPHQWSRPSGIDDAEPRLRTDSQRLQAVLARTGARRVLAPVERVLAEGLAVHRWEVVRERPTGEGEVRVHVPHRAAGEPVAPPAHSLAVRALLDGRPVEALAQLTALTAAPCPDTTRGALLRWVALCQLALDRPQEALMTLVQTWQEHPDASDLYSLAAMAAVRCGFDVDPAALDEVLRVTGPSTRLAEWFVEQQHEPALTGCATADATPPVVPA